MRIREKVSINGEHDEMGAASPGRIIRDMRRFHMTSQVAGTGLADLQRANSY